MTKQQKFTRSIGWIGLLVTVLLIVSCGGAPQPDPQNTAAPTLPKVAATQVVSTQPVVTAGATKDLQPSAVAATATVAGPAQTQKGVSAPVWKELVDGLNRPTDLAEIPDGSGLLVVLEQPGTARVIKKTGELLAQPFLDLRDRVGSEGNEQGLLGIAFHPKFADNGYFYVNYTDRDGNSVVARFTGKAGSDTVDAGTQTVILRVRQPYANHNGGGVVFGPDGYLYLSFGDGGSGGDPQNNGQSLNTFLGKILRIDVNQGDPYAIPADNPFAKGGGLPEIWAYGLRNPWRFSFDRANGDLYIADVGQNLYEEINYVPAGSAGGLNFGWRIREGLHGYKGNPPAGVKFVDPIWEYGHDQGCSVTGGFVYHGARAPQYQGSYIYTDYCTGRIWGLRRDANGQWQHQELAESGASISGFGLDLQGDLYLLEHNKGKILRLE